MNNRIYQRPIDIAAEVIIDAMLCYWDGSKYVAYTANELAKKLDNLKEKEQIELTAQLMIAGYKLK